MKPLSILPCGILFALIFLIYLKMEGSRGDSVKNEKQKRKERDRTVDEDLVKAALLTPSTRIRKVC